MYLLNWYNCSGKLRYQNNLGLVKKENIKWSSNQHFSLHFSFQVETIDGNVHEGLFRTFSPDLEITLEQAHQVDPKNPTTITAEVVKEIMIFEMKEVLHMSAIGVDLDYAAKGTV